MNMVRQTLLVVILASVLQVSMGGVYKVGDGSGWTTIGNVDYKKWAADKTFAIGDVVVFEYNPQYHDVMEVTHAMYRSCNASSPIATYTTGNDSITINSSGHHFFLCSVPGHCQSGQKVDINVVRASSAPSQSPVPTVAVPVPSPSGAAAFYATFGKSVFAALTICIFA
ncbi:PREDICTED: mavicyanin-like isoform X2 [Ipomoea nil]|uniref:mavicyanin-like isoform X1 n=1 Tax=Ipomoea nil TaxID=35883 RepID=UPI0009014D8A|nr:PREDICTED: mavicyanin-like isoform X1 [Ipomoea nil]XP_019168195.1 PREDICTED: mavicyanin-like isoform X2 [Ipomoea nil]